MKRNPVNTAPPQDYTKGFESLQTAVFENDEGVSMHTILGAGGVIGNELTKELCRRGERVRLVSRKPRQADGTEAVSADISNPDQAVSAVSGPAIVYLVIGLKYSTRTTATISLTPASSQTNSS